MPLLRGDGVFLRPLEEGDLERSHEWFLNPGIYVTMGVYAPRSMEEHRRWYRDLVGSRTNRVFAVCTTVDDVHIGNCSLFDIDHRNANAGLTIFIADEERRGKAFGSEAVSLLCGYALEYLNLHRIAAKTDNPVAARVYERLGFQLEGTLRGSSFQGGRYVDKYLYALLRDEFTPFVGHAAA